MPLYLNKFDPIKGIETNSQISNVTLAATYFYKFDPIKGIETELYRHHIYHHHLSI